jgi:hypothetical protein
MRRPADSQPSRPLPDEAPVPARTPTLARYLTRWLTAVVEPDLEPATYAYYETMARLYVSPALGSIRLDRLQLLLFIGQVEQGGARVAPHAPSAGRRKCAR